MKRILLAVLWGALWALPWWLPAIGGYTALGSKVLIYGIATMGLNLLLGFTGGLSFGQAVYFGLGAYSAGTTLKYLAASTPLAIVVGTSRLGPLAMRRRGIYFAMITIAIGQLFYFVAVRWNEVTGGEDGLAGFARQDIHLGNSVVTLTEINFYYLVLLCCGFLLLNRTRVSHCLCSHCRHRYGNLVRNGHGDGGKRSVE